MKTLYILGRNVDDEAVATLTSALANNHKFITLGLHRLGIPTNPSITEKSWEALSKLLCDTSSINSTFLSNHKLECIRVLPNADANPITPLLLLNKNKNKKEVAMIKILQNHNEFDMLPFFEWEFKVLPLMINWFEKASAITNMPSGFLPNIGPRKLSSIYQFVRGMPLLCRDPHQEGISGNKSLGITNGRRTVSIETRTIDVRLEVTTP